MKGEFRLVCEVCLQGIDPRRQQETRLRVRLFGAASKYAICSGCAQEVPRPWKKAYRERWKKGPPLDCGSLPGYHFF